MKGGAEDTLRSRSPPRGPAGSLSPRGSGMVNFMHQPHWLSAQRADKTLLPGMSVRLFLEGLPLSEDPPRAGGHRPTDWGPDGTERGREGGSLLLRELRRPAAAPTSELPVLTPSRLDWSCTPSPPLLAGRSDGGASWTPGLCQMIPRHKALSMPVYTGAVGSNSLESPGRTTSLPIWPLSATFLHF